MALEQDILSIGFDYKKTQSDADKVIASLQGVLDYSDKLSSIKDILGGATGGFSNSKKASQELTEALKEQNRVALEYNKTLIATANAHAAEAKAAAARVKADQEVVKLIREEDKAQKENINTKKSALQYEILIEKQKMKGVKAGEAEAKVIEKAADEYYQLGQALKDAENRYKNLYLIGQGQSDAAKQALQQALSIRKVLDTVDQSLGNFQRGVGNYATGFNGLNNSIQQILREAPSAAVSLNTFFLAISNNLPMFFDEISKIKKEQEALNVSTKEAAIIAKEQAIAQALQAGATKEAAIAEGLLAEETLIANAAQKSAPGLLRQIAGSLFSLQSALTVGVLLLTLFGSELIAATGKMFTKKKIVDDLTDSFENLKKTQKDYNEVVNKSGQAAQKEITDLRILEKAATDVAKPMSVRLQAVKDLQDQYPKYLGNIDKEAILNGQAAAQINLVADALIKKAFYEAASNKATEKASKNIDLKLRENFLVNEIAKSELNLQDARDKYNKSNLEQSVAIALNTSDRLRNVVSEQDHLTSLNSLLNQNRKDQKLNSSEIQLFTKLAADNFETIKKLEIDPKGKKEKDIKTIAEVIAELRNELKGIQSETDNGILSINEADLKRLEKYKSAIAEIFTLKATDAAKGDAGFKLSVELRPISLRILENQILEFTKKNPIKYDIKPPDFKEAIRISDSYKAGEIRLYEEISARQIVVRQTQSLRELNILEEKFSKGKISQEKYEEEVLKIISASSKVQIKEQLDFVNRQLAVADFGTKAREDAEKKIAELTLAYNKIISDDRKKKQQELISELQQLQELFNKLSSIGASIVNISVTKEKNALQDVEDTRQKNYANEVERINASSISEEDKANKLKLLDAQRQAQKDEFDRRTREASLKQAKFDKAAAIANIAISTALAIVKALPNIPLSIAVGILGAAELAVAASTPLPRYAKGLKNNPIGHTGVFGESGKELIEMPGRDPFIADRETVAFIPKGTNITPIGRDQINGVMYRAMAKNTAESLRKTAGPERTEMLLEQLISATKNSKDKVKVYNIFDKLPPGWAQYERSYYSKG